MIRQITISEDNNSVGFNFSYEILELEKLIDKICHEEDINPINVKVKSGIVFPSNILNDSYFSQSQCSDAKLFCLKRIKKIAEIKLGQKEFIFKRIERVINNKNIFFQIRKKINILKNTNVAITSDNLLFEKLKSDIDKLKNLIDGKMDSRFNIEIVKTNNQYIIPENIKDIMSGLDFYAAIINSDGVIVKKESSDLNVLINVDPYESEDKKYILSFCLKYKYEYKNINITYNENGSFNIGNSFIGEEIFLNKNEAIDHLLNIIEKNKKYLLSIKNEK